MTQYAERFCRMLYVRLHSDNQNERVYGLVSCPEFEITRKQRFRNWLFLRLQVIGGRQLLCWVR
jgi:hypothetical protein